MADERYTFEQARVRLEELVSEVRKKDTSLEKSLDLLEEGVRLANVCTELVERADPAGASGSDAPPPAAEAEEEPTGSGEPADEAEDDAEDAGE